jgi:hypothetical protein
LQGGQENWLIDIKARKEEGEEGRGWGQYRRENDTGERISCGKRVDRGAWTDAGAVDDGRKV